MRDFDPAISQQKSSIGNLQGGFKAMK